LIQIKNAPANSGCNGAGAMNPPLETRRRQRRAVDGARLVAALQRPECYPHPVAGTPRIVETHISWVILTGEYAYKIKKPVDLRFVDFSTLARRRRYCREELRLNRRLAPELYLEVVAIGGEPGAPRIGGDGPALEYAVRMREFPQQRLASRALAAGAFGAPEIDALADLLARFHERAAIAPQAGHLGTPGAVLGAALQNFDQMLPLAPAPGDREALRALRGWTEREHAARREAFAARKAGGFVRECHGDLHLRNIVLLDGRPVPFDGIEFNEALRWIDVMSEIAFLAMDLEDRGRRDLAWRFVNRYLDATGDYAGIEVLRFYLAHRALVRAKVHLLRSRQPRLARGEKSRLALAFRHYLRLAGRYAVPEQAALIVTHGLSGCGKTTAAQALLEQLGAVRLRSDLERKRLHGLAPLAASGSAVASGIYTRDASAALYRRLGQLAGRALAAGFPVIVDAAFLRRAEREAFRAVAERLDVPFLILDFRAPLAVLRARVAARRSRGNDASEADLAVLEHQISARDPLTPAEMARALPLDAALPAPADAWRAVAAQVRGLTSGPGLRRTPAGLPRRRAPRRAGSARSARAARVRPERTQWRA
jgi:aminoglycoside phosphotransferase family enzyme/predicted kinase